MEKRRKRKKLDRSQMMRAVKSENTKPEWIVRRALFRAGMRYRLHRRDLPGTPDLFVLKYGVVVFVNGCFWHQHGCRFARRPKSNVDFWKEKFDNNAARDVRTLRELFLDGYRVAVVWECSLRMESELALDRLVAFIRGKEECVEI